MNEIRRRSAAAAAARLGYAKRKAARRGEGGADTGGVARGTAVSPAKVVIVGMTKR